MILILEDNTYDESFDHVVDWLIHLKSRFYRLNINDIISGKIPLELDNVENKLIIDGIDFQSEVNVVWYRRFYPQHAIENLTIQMRADLRGEVNHLIECIFSVLRNKKWYPDFSNITVNKILILEKAASFGLTVPKSYVVNNITTLNEVRTRIGDLIMKPINFCGYHSDGDKVSTAYTIKLDDHKIKELEKSFFPTLVQQQIKAKFEIRSFYIDEAFYSTAIVCSERQHSDIKLDVNSGNANSVPFELPSLIKEKLIEFMNDIDLNTGSIDLIVDQNDQFFFLEVNPIGQFIAPSNRCNFDIDMKIAQLLTYQDEKQYERVI